MKPPRSTPSLLFRLIVPAAVLFITTVLALIATLFGDPKAPVSIWLDAHGNTILIWEFIAVLVLSLAAMTVDRIRTLRGIDEAPVRSGTSDQAIEKKGSVRNEDPSAESK